MSRLGFFTLLLAILFLASASPAQNLTLFTAFSSPSGSFAKNIGDNPVVTRKNGFDVGQGAGFAVNGYAAGIDIALPTLVLNLSWLTTISFNQNGTDDAQVQKTFSSLVDDDDVVAFEYSRWLQIPVMTGFQYDLSVVQELRIYGLVQGGIDFIKPATRKATVNGKLVDQREYDFARQFGFGLGAGLIFMNRLDLGVRYYDFGDPLLDGTRFLSRDYFQRADRIIGKDLILGEKRPVANLFITLGYRF